MEIVGHHRVIEFLQKSIRNNKLAHAYLFYGPRHIGKTSIAQYLAIHLLCLKRKACGTCLSCKQVLSRIHPDVYWLSDKKSIGIDAVRNIISMLNREPLSGDYKVAIIEQADNLTIQAANSFLKLLEEASQRTIIILIARSFYHLPVTIRSRCQILRFSIPLREDVASFLKKKFDLKKEQIAEILHLSMGRPGLAITLAKDPDIFHEHREIMHEFMNSLLKDNLEDKLALVNVILNSQQSALTSLLILIRTLILIKLDYPLIERITNEKLKVLSKKYSIDRLVQMAFRILQTESQLNYNVNKRLAIENLLINI